MLLGYDRIRHLTRFRLRQELTEEQLRRGLQLIEEVCDECSHPENVRSEPYVRELVFYNAIAAAGLGAFLYSILSWALG